MALNVVALGGNAILEIDPSDDGQKSIVQKASQHLAKFVASGEALAICHGNGPQVGNLILQQEAAHSLKNPAFKLDSCVAMTQGSIGYWLQNALSNELLKNNIFDKVPLAVITQVKVDVADQGFQNPTKPVGPFYTREVAKEMMELDDCIYKEDAGRGYRKMVASPVPLKILEEQAIKMMLSHQMIPICAGGGGIPVVVENGFTGIEAVIDKDYSASLLADTIGADRLIILTAVENVYINYNQDNQEKLEIISISELEDYISENHFAEGSMLPKIQAAINFVKGNSHREAVITSLENLEKINEGAGTVIRN